MGNYPKYLTNLYQTFTDIKAVKVMNVYQILVIYLIPEKNNGQKVCFKGNLKILVASLYAILYCIEKTSHPTTH
jgi:hypothetical protein